MPDIPKTFRIAGTRKLSARQHNADAYRKALRVEPWVSFREVYLINHPNCVLCKEKGELVRANTVDHVMPISGPDDPRFLDENEVQALCGSCHSAKTREDMRRGLTRNGGSER